MNPLDESAPLPHRDGHFGSLALSDPELANRLRDPSPEIRAAAILVLHQLGPRAQPFSSRLVDLLTDPDSTVRERAAFALVEIAGIDSSARDRLSSALNDDSPRVRVSVARALWSVDPSDQATLPTFLAGLKDEEAFVRWNAAVGLADMGPAAAPALAALEKALHDRDDGVQMHAARALGNLAKEPERIIPALIALVREHSARRVQTPGQQLQIIVHAALYRFGAVAVPFLARALHDENDDLRLYCLSVLGHLGHLAAPTLATLAVLLGDGNPAVRRRAAFVLGQIGPDVEAAAPLLQVALDDADVTVRVAAARALWRIGAWSDKAFRMLAGAVIESSTPSAARVSAIQGLGGLGPAAAQIVPSLERLLASSSNPASERHAAALALWQIAGDLSGVEDCVLSALDNVDAQGRTEALRLLTGLGKGAVRFQGVIERLKADPNPAVRATAEAVAKQIQER